MNKKYPILPILACTFALIVFPILNYVGSTSLTAQPDSRPEPRIFWPIMIAIAVMLAARSRSRAGKFSWPPNIAWLLAYLAFAGASVLWAFSPESSFVRFVQQVMVVGSITLPILSAPRTADMLQGLFACFALAVVLNFPFILIGSVTLARYGTELVDIGYEGYFHGKNYLGECATVAFLLALHETRYPGLRRVFGAIIVVLALLLVFLANSKTALGLAIIAPLLAWITLTVWRIARISPAITILLIPFIDIAVSSISNFTMNRISFMLYGDSTFTGRTVIWDFALYEIGRSPLVGWGYQSFWLVGSNAPSVLDAPGWVKLMPNAHNGYYDTMLETGYIGFALLLMFILTTLHGIGRVVDRDPTRALFLMSLALFIILYNFLESLWMRGFEFLWVVFIIVAADIGQYWRPLSPPEDLPFDEPLADEIAGDVDHAFNSRG